MGVVVGGAGYNAAVFLVPLGAFIGWLLASRSSTALDHSLAPTHVETGTLADQSSETEFVFRQGAGMIFHSALAILASIWNFQIDTLKALGLLPAFVRQPLLFAGLCIVVSMVFPPFLGLYFFAWLAANHFGLSEECQYRVTVK